MVWFLPFARRCSPEPVDSPDWLPVRTAYVSVPRGYDESVESDRDGDSGREDEEDLLLRPKEHSGQTSRLRIVSLSVMIPLVLGFATVAGLSTAQQRSWFRADATTRAVGLMERRGRLSCGSMENDTNYWTRNKPVVRLRGITDKDVCQSRCFEEPRCMTWSWGERRGATVLSDVCLLKELEMDEKPWRKHEVGVVSGGLPCPTEKLAARTLYCFSLMMPHGYETDLLTWQRSANTSIFGCDEHAVYSNRSFLVAPGVMTNGINSSLECKVGGEWGTALNLDIFMAVWRHVIFDGRFQHYDWTVKVDPDAVFLPERLRRMLPHHIEVPEGVYLNNCKFGMHGPIEVFSRNAVNSWAAGSDKCVRHFSKLCKGTCGWGEDMFIDQCLMRVLNVRRDNEWALLLEDHCAPDPKHPMPWSTSVCRDTHAAFHPFKNQSAYAECLNYTIEFTKGAAG